MAFPKLTPRHSLLLLFKDDLPESAGRGFPLVSESTTILKHLDIHGPRAGKGEVTGQRQQLEVERSLFPDLPRTDDLWPELPPQGCCVWGWWRKPWEYHPSLFEAIRRHAEDGKILEVLLYNQYLRRIYKAKLHGLYFLPFLTSVPVPGTWYDACPAYYRKEPRLCGAFLLLKIEPDPVEDTAAFLGKLYVDTGSFELVPNGLEMVIRPDESVREIVSLMIDKPINRSRLRESDHTVLLLRAFSQVDMTTKLLQRGGKAKDQELADSFAETEWSDVRALLSGCPPFGWSKLDRSKRALGEISQKARLAGSRITRFDLELAAWAFSCADLGELFVAKEGGRHRTLTVLGDALREWVTAPSAAEARGAAAEVFEAAWNFASNRYGLSGLSDYFRRLPALEAVTSAVQHEIGRKFYRDHLSHNVRAALLAARLVHKIGIRPSEGVEPCCIAFFAGLFHDIALPISSFPEIVNDLASAVAILQAQPSSFRAQGLLETDFLHLSLHYVALLSSVPGLLSEYPTGCCPWDRPEEAVAPADKRLLQELLLCAKSEDHAIISAAVLFHRAVLRRCNDDLKNIDAGVRTLMTQMTGAAATKGGKEFLGVLQCIALHDRNASLEFHPVATHPREAPAHLSWDSFALPIVVSLADDFQEWGRPVGSLEGVGVVDAKVDLEGGRIIANYEWNADPRTFSNVPYSLLHMLIGKLRICGAFSRADGGTLRPFEVSCNLNGLQAFALQYVAHRDFVLKFGAGVISVDMKSWPKEGAGITVFSGGTDQHLIGIRLAEAGGEGHDFLVIEGDPSSSSEMVAAARNSRRLWAVKLEGPSISLECEDGSAVVGELIECHFGEIIEGSAPTGPFPRTGACSVFRVRLASGKGADSLITQRERHGVHLLPHPHYLDLDWRFTERTAKWISVAAKHHAGGGNVCYLGCPTVALYHNLLHEPDTKWTLLDRGHFGLRKWLDGMMPKAQWIDYDVFDALPHQVAGNFDVVVTDPPWYEDDYRAFCRRAAQLVKAQGFVFVSSYPPYPPYKPQKYTIFENILKAELSDPTWLGSVEIDYEIPEFEKTWDGHKQFQHPGLRVYRPGYLDMYRVRNVSARPITGRRPERPMPCSKEMAGGHHVQYANELSFPCRVNVERYNSLRRPKLPDSTVAWTSKNAIVKLSEKGAEVHDIDALLTLIEEWEDRSK